MSIVIATFSFFATVARASGLTLTPDGISRGFKISTFASNFPTDPNNVYDLNGAGGVLFTNKGLLVGNEAFGTVQLFARDCDGRDASKVAPTAYYAVGLGGPTGMVKGKFQGKPRYYLATWQSEVFEINPDGTPIRKSRNRSG